MKLRFCIAALVVIILQSCASAKTQKVEIKQPTPVSRKITFRDLIKQGKLWGIDLSHYQEVLDWDKLKSSKPDFIFLKATEGSTIRDEKYEEFYKKLRKLKIPVGSYHFFTYKTSGKDQANNFLSTSEYKSGDLPLVLDAEYAKTMPDKKQVVKELLDFIKVVYAKEGIYPIVYCDYKYYLFYLQNSLPEKCKLWIVDYRGKPNCDWTFWQTTDKFKIDGIKGYVDFNMFYGTKQQLKSLLR